ncbi:glycosyl transferase [Mesorhizobium sp. NBSH29]|uniref:glycosyltransferase family protein n=1 Tax=Mesorhizobium sp. NBSH29 TaxID=2654249 RepID=UPI0018968F06|nr:glycosyltransferase [Mesorhizobium sp. NBSH29]QPC87914.1 glycosyl transferase [Mesorhizobium sp. NBSH29]
MAPCVLFYVQHLLGIGHLARATHIARALNADGFEVLMVTGGMPVPGFPDTSIRNVALPPVAANDQGFSGLADLDGNPVDQIFQANRTRLLLGAFKDFAPDIVITEAFPFGRRQMRFELLPLLDAIRHARPKPLLVASLRDILQERTKPGRDEETVDLVNTHFDSVMVHGDPAFIRLEDSFRLAGAIADKIAYTGLVTGPAHEPGTDRFDVVVSAGGGAAGGALVQAAAAAAHLCGPALSWCLITGPNLPKAQFDAAAAQAPENVSLFRFRNDFGQLLSGANLSVSQAGYNTVCDILVAGCRTILVPFSAGGETEQTVRAGRLAAEGLATMLIEPDLTPETLAGAITTALSHPRPNAQPLNLDGAAGTAHLLRQLLG